MHSLCFSKVYDFSLIIVCFCKIRYLRAVLSASKSTTYCTV